MSKKTILYESPKLVEVTIRSKSVIATSECYSDGSADGIEEIYDL